MTRERGVLYIVWGDQIEAALQRSIASVKRTHPELPIEVIRAKAEGGPQDLLQKANMLALSPFRDTLFLDADTVVLDRLEFAFEKARRFGLACCICECPWARRYTGQRGDLIEYKTGVMFFTAGAKPVFDTWKALAGTLDSSIRFFKPGDPTLYRMAYNDQGSFAAAIEQCNFNPFILPLNWNFRPLWQKSFFGPIKIWHDYSDVPPGLAKLSDYYRREDAIVQYHAAV